MMLGHLPGVAVKFFKLDPQDRQGFEVVGRQVAQDSGREKSCLHRYSLTCSRYFKLAGICFSETGDSSSRKYHFTPAFLAAFNTAGRSIWPVPRATSLLTSLLPVRRPVGVPFFISLRCISWKRLWYFCSSLAGSCPGCTI